MDQCYICKINTPIMFCGCDYFNLCKSCCNSYMEKCYKLNMPLGCPLCNEEILIDRFKEDTEVYCTVINKLLKKGKTHQLITPQNTRKALKQLVEEDHQSVENSLKNAPTGLKTSILVILKDKVKKQIKLNHTDYSEILESSKDICLCGKWCGGTVEKQDKSKNVCDKCGILSCVKCKFEFLKGHNCDDARLNSIPVKLYCCPECSSIAELYKDSKELTCRKGHNIPIEESNEYKLSKDVDNENIVKLEDVKYKKVKALKLTDNLEENAENYKNYKSNLLYYRSNILKLLAIKNKTEEYRDKKGKEMSNKKIDKLLIAN